MREHVFFVYSVQIYIRTTIINANNMKFIPFMAKKKINCNKSFFFLLLFIVCLFVRCQNRALNAVVLCLLFLSLSLVVVKVITSAKHTCELNFSKKKNGNIKINIEILNHMQTDTDTPTSHEHLQLQIHVLHYQWIIKTKIKFKRGAFVICIYINRTATGCLPLKDQFVWYCSFCFNLISSPLI